MSALDHFVSLNIAVLTVSDTRTRDNDSSGDYLDGALRSAGHRVAAREVAALLAERAHPIAGAVRLGGAVRHGAAPAHAGLARATVAVGRARRLDRAAIEAEAAGRGAVGAEELVAEAHRRGPEVAPRRDAVAGAGARERLLGREPAARGDDRHPRGAHQNRTVEDRVAWSTSPPDENAWPGS